MGCPVVCNFTSFRRRYKMHSVFFGSTMFYNTIMGIYHTINSDLSTFLRIFLGRRVDLEYNSIVLENSNFYENGVGLSETFFGAALLAFVFCIKSVKSLQQSRIFTQYSIIIFCCSLFLLYSSNLVELAIS